MEVWYGFISERCKERMESVQNAAPKLIFSGYETYSERLRVAGLVTVRETYEQRCSKCFETLPNAFSSFLNQYLNKGRRSSRQHHGSKYKFSFNTKLFSKSFFIHNFLSTHVNYHFGCFFSY